MAAMQAVRGALGGGPGIWPLCLLAFVLRGSPSEPLGNSSLASFTESGGFKEITTGACFVNCTALPGTRGPACWWGGACLSPSFPRRRVLCCPRWCLPCSGQGGSGGQSTVSKSS